MFGGTVLHGDHLVGGVQAGCFAFRWFVACGPSYFFILPLGVTGRLCSVIVALSGHCLYYFGPEISLEVDLENVDDKMLKTLYGFYYTTALF